RYKIEDNGSSFKGTELEPVLSSSDPNFRPSDIKIGPDGAIYFIDWHNPIIGHMQHNLRDPSRDREHGRIYRVTYEGRALAKPPKIAGAPEAGLIDLALRIGTERESYRARSELHNRDVKRAAGLAAKVADTLKMGGPPDDPDGAHIMLEALWLRQAFNEADERLLQDVL